MKNKELEAIVWNDCKPVDERIVAAKGVITNRCVYGFAGTCAGVALAGIGAALSSVYSYDTAMSGTGVGLFLGGLLGTYFSFVKHAPIAAVANDTRKDLKAKKEEEKWLY